MRSKLSLLILAIAVAALFASGCATTQMGKTGAENDKWIGTKAPDFSLPDINGKPHRLSDYQGKVVMMYFSMWCQTCFHHVLHIKNSLYEKYKGKDLAIFAVDYTGADTEYLARLSKELELPFVILLDDGSLMKYYNGAMAITVIIDQQGMIQHKYFYTKKTDKILETLVNQ